MLVIGVTGSIGAGKSHLSRYLVEGYGAVHCDVDMIVHATYASGRPAFDRIVAAFGSEVVGANGEIDRHILGSQVFGSLDRARVLRDAIGDYAPDVRSVVDGWRASLAVGQVAVLEAFNLVSGGYYRWCDVRWLVRAEDDVAVRRIMQRGQLTDAEARARLASAVPWQRSVDHCDLIIDNNGTVAEFEAAIDGALSNYRVSIEARAPRHER